MNRLRRTKIYLAAIAIASTSILASSAAWGAESIDNTQPVLIGSVSGDSLADVLTRSESLNDPGDLEKFLDRLAAEATAGRSVAILGFENESPQKAVELLSDAQSSLRLEKPFSDDVQRFEVVPESVAVAADKTANANREFSGGVAPMSAENPSTPSDYTVWGEAFNANHSWQWENVFKIDECQLASSPWW